MTGGSGRTLLDRASAEEIVLGLGDRAGTLDRVLDPLRLPAWPDELAGEDAAAEMFLTTTRGTRPYSNQRARTAPTGPKHRRSRTMPRTMVLGAASVVLAGSGLAVAGVTGALPLPPIIDSPRTPHSGPTTVRGGATAGHVPLLTPREAEQCRMFLALSPADAAVALDRPPMKALVDRAGGSDEVRTFCATALDASASGSPQGTPGPNRTQGPAGTDATSGPPGGNNGKGPKEKTKAPNPNSSTRPTPRQNQDEQGQAGRTPAPTASLPELSASRLPEAPAEASAETPAEATTPAP